ncbi:rod shape-determining protein [Teredinibacter purpureus]|uniref:rod shape-determining protein n=1 Tax=Teredinibacter purpureus TaxID=2731756 RepID=UPI0005F7CDEF|nr:rod shape-determining protein [Teredinibacter purpureus]
MIFNSIKKIFSGTVYVQLSESNIRIYNIESDLIYDQSPYIAIDKSNPKKEIVHAIGNEAEHLKGSLKYEVTNPFSHPRLLVSCFIKAEKVLLHGIREVHKNKFFAPSPIVVIHPIEKLEGGITDIECRVYRELALGAGAREVHLHVGTMLNTKNFNLNQVVEPEIA